ncbi:MAG TPA: hypothetical protein ENI23_00330 [bacterium]|nr:hypothetical protein [bacterium]
MLESFRDEKLEETTRLHALDMSIVEGEVREIQATAYCGDLVLSFMHGKLTPISRRNQTKKII